MLEVCDCTKVITMLPCNSLIERQSIAVEICTFWLCLLTAPISAHANLAAPENDAQLKSQYEQLMFVQKDLESQKDQVAKTQQELKVQREQVNKTINFIWFLGLSVYISNTD